MVVYIVMTDDCNENDCGCYSESIDSVWLNEEKAKEKAKSSYKGYVKKLETED